MDLRAFRPFRRALLSARGGLSIPFLDPIPPNEGGAHKGMEQGGRWITISISHSAPCHRLIAPSLFFFERGKELGA